MYPNTPPSSNSFRTGSPSILSPRPQAPPSNLPTDRLSSQAEQLYINNDNNNYNNTLNINNNNIQNNNNFYRNSPSPNYINQQPQQQQQARSSPLPQQQQQQQRQYANNPAANYVMPQFSHPAPSQHAYDNRSQVLQSNYYQAPLVQQAPARRGAYSEAVPDFPSSLPQQHQRGPSFSNQQQHFNSNQQKSGAGGGQYYQMPSPGQPSPQQNRHLGGSNSRSGSSIGGGPLSLDSLSISVSGSSSRSYYATPEDGPPYKLSVVHPDQNALGVLRDRAVTGGINGQGDIIAKVAWSKQVLKFIERHQSTAGESSRIDDPTLVRWTDEALNHILTSASSPSPVPLALYLRGDLSSSGSFPSYRSKDSKSAFRDFEASANLGYSKAWFRIGRAYEEFGDLKRAIAAYDKGMNMGDCGSTYRLAMANLLGQIGMATDYKRGVELVERAADLADVDTPQPPYILGMLLTGEFESPSVQLPKGIVPLNIEEAKSRIERAAFLSFGPAQYKMGFSYEYATLGCLFDPLLSVQYYALASQNGEVEADMALSKWYLCGSEGNFEKNEALAVTFAEKAAARNLPSAEFALGYYREVGINGIKDLEKAKRWYARAAGHGNQDAQDRLVALAASWENALSRSDHESQVDIKLIRKRTQAQARSNEQREASKSLASNTNATTRLGANYSAGGSYSDGSDRRASGQSVDSAAKMRKRDTMRQVEVAAVMNMLDSHGLSNNSARGSTSSDSSAHLIGNGASSGGGRPSYQLSDTPSGRSSKPQQEIVTSNKKPETFADMGIVTQKAKKDDCLVM